MEKDSDLPSQFEKLSYKFILDAVREISLENKAIEALGNSETLSVPQLTPNESLCGTLSQKPSQLELDISSVEDKELVNFSPIDLPLDKKYFRIREVSELLEIEPYVLRYWETEFSFVKPVKSGSGHRVYTRKDIEALHLIKHLVHVEKYSIKGAKAKFHDRRKSIQKQALPDKQQMKEIVQELRDLISIIREQ